MALRFLHFSDIHFGQERGDGTWQPYDDVREEVLVDIERVRHRGLIAGPADAILVTGDIAQAGAEAEFKTASAWLDRALELAGCPPRAIRSVPGNHDVNLSRLDAAALQTHNVLRNATVEDAYAYLAAISGNPHHTIAQKFIDYRGFAHAYGSDFTSDSNPVSITRYPLAGGAGIRLIGFSTVIISDRRDEEGKLLLGANQYQISRERGYEDIVMMHHPLSWLKDRSHAEPYINSRARLLLTGHEHSPTLTKVEHDNAFEQLRVAAGALTPPQVAEGYSYAFNWIELEWLEMQDGQARLAVTVYPRAWDAAATRFGPDRNRLQSGESRRLILGCEPQDPPVSAARPTPVPIEAAAELGGAEEAVDTVDCLSLPETDAVPDEVHDAENYERLRYLFWRHLNREQRIDALISLSLLTEKARQRLPSSMEQEAFDDAAASNLLAALWDITMTHVPKELRSENPFKGHS